MPVKVQLFGEFNDEIVVLDTDVNPEKASVTAEELVILTCPQTTPKDKTRMENTAARSFGVVENLLILGAEIGACIRGVIYSANIV